MHISSYFQAVSAGLPAPNPQAGKLVGDLLIRHTAEDGFPDLDGVSLVLFGIADGRGSKGNEGCQLAPDAVRPFLYSLFQPGNSVKVADLGNIVQGKRLEDTWFAVTAVVEELTAAGITCILLGGGQELTAACYSAFRNRKQITNIAVVDNVFDLGETGEDLNARSYLGHIVLQKPSFLFNYTQIGYQTYMVDPSAIDLMQNLFFDAYRLGPLSQDITLTEPLIRNTDIFSFDMAAIRMSDSPAHAMASPNGFYGEQACQMARYAGMSDKVSVAGFFEMNPEFDQRGQSACLLAQMIWYFIEGFGNREGEQPAAGNDNFVRYHVQLAGQDDGVVFYHSKRTDRWWMEVKCPLHIREKFHRHYIVPCSPQDYRTALNNELPDRWWQAYQKLM